MSFLYNRKVFHVLVILTGLYNLYYLWWRVAFTMNETAIVFSLLLLLAEVQGLINFYLYAMMTWNTEPRPQPAPLIGASADVFIPTYNEDVKVLEATLVGCAGITYPHKTYLLDDGNRPEVKALAAQYECGYLFRTENRHAKAGNINEALPQTSGEFIVILDADTVPQPDFLDKTIGYFVDPKVAIVQLPQEFYNLDSMQHTKHTSYWHEQQLFYHIIQPGKDRINAAFWCGSPSVVRRAALIDIGGVATDVVTEDFLTSIRLNAKGWQIRYHHETLAFGIAPQSYHAFNVQRLRWAQGSMKILLSRDNPLIKRGLSLRQRLSHFAAIFTYFDAYQKLIYLLAPVVFLLTGLLPLKITSGTDFVLHWLPYFGLTALTIGAFGRGYYKTIEVEKYNTLKMVTFIKASLTFFLPKRNKFLVTPKTVETSAKARDRKELTAHIIILSLITFAVLWGSVNTIFNLSISHPSILGVAVALFWSCYNGFIMLLALHDVLSRLYYRQDFRFPVALESYVAESDKKYTAHVNNISRGGLSLFGLESDTISEHTIIEICLPDGVMSLPGNVVYNRTAQDGKKALGIKFDELNAEQRMQLCKFLYVTMPAKIFAEGGMSPSSMRRKRRQDRKAAGVRIQNQRQDRFKS